MRVLLVEDDVDVRTMIEWALTKHNGFDIVASVGTADEALAAMVSGAEVDVLVSDYMLQGSSMDGLALCREVHDEYGIPAVLVSAVPHLLHDEDGNPQVTPFLTKPFTPDDLRAAVKAAAPPQSTDVGTP